MPKFFVASDIHSFYDEYQQALKKAGFENDNPNHWLIVCGDCFDRGSQSFEVLNFLSTHPRAILIRGNHETLLEQACKRGYCQLHDLQNGTYQTIMDIGGAGEGFSEKECCHRTIARVGNFLSKMVWYFETENYVFTHGWLPVWLEDKGMDWRDGLDSDWEEVSWENGMKCARAGDTIDKTVVCGHYHTSWGHAIQDKTFEEWGEGADFTPYYDDGIIAIDGCTAYSGLVNVIVLEDNFLEAKN